MAQRFAMQVLYEEILGSVPGRINLGVLGSALVVLVIIIQEIPWFETR